MTRVAVIGIGAMGGRIARRLLEAGHDVVVWNRDPARIAPPRFSLSLARKDADLILEAAAATGTDLRLGAAARTWFAEAGSEGPDDRDYSAVLARILKRRSHRSRT